MLKYEGLFSVGDRIRSYDYDPKKMEGTQVYAEGEIEDIVSHPFKAYKIQCDTCTHFGRVGETMYIPMERASHEFDGRVLRAPQ